MSNSKSISTESMLVMLVVVCVIFGIVVVGYPILSATIAQIISNVCEPIATICY